MSRIPGNNDAGKVKVSEEAMNNIRSIVREGLDVLGQSADLYVGRELKGTWAEKGMYFYRVSVDAEDITSGFFLFCRSEQRQAFKLVLCNSDGKVMYSEESRRNCSEAIMYFTTFDTFAHYPVFQLENGASTTIPGASLVSNPPKNVSTSFAVPGDECDTALGVFNALDGMKSSRKTITPGKYLLCVLAAGGAARGGFTMSMAIAKSTKDITVRELAQTDAEVFQTRVAMQELKTGYLKAKAEYIHWLQRAAQEEARVNALLEKRDKAYANFADASLKASNLPVRPHVIHDKQGIGATAAAWFARQILVGKSAISAMVRSPSANSSQQAGTPQQERPPRPYSTPFSPTPAAQPSSSLYTTPTKAAPAAGGSTAATPAAGTPSSGSKILARYIYVDEGEGVEGGEGAAAAPSAVAPSATAAVSAGIAATSTSAEAPANTALAQPAHAEESSAAASAHVDGLTASPAFTPTKPSRSDSGDATHAPAPAAPTSSPGDSRNSGSPKVSSHGKGSRVLDIYPSDDEGEVRGHEEQAHHVQPAAAAPALHASKEETTHASAAAVEEVVAAPVQSSPVTAAKAAPSVGGASRVLDIYASDDEAGGTVGAATAQEQPAATEVVTATPQTDSTLFPTGRPSIDTRTAGDGTVAAVDPAPATDASPSQKQEKRAETAADSAVTPTRSPKHVHWPEESPVLSECDAPAALDDSIVVETAEEAAGEPVSVEQATVTAAPASTSSAGEIAGNNVAEAVISEAAELEPAINPVQDVVVEANTEVPPAPVALSSPSLGLTAPAAAAEEVAKEVAEAEVTAPEPVVSPKSPGTPKSPATANGSGKKKKGKGKGKRKSAGNSNNGAAAAASEEVEEEEEVGAAEVVTEAEVEGSREASPVNEDAAVISNADMTATLKTEAPSVVPTKASVAETATSAAGAAAAEVAATVEPAAEAVGAGEGSGELNDTLNNSDDFQDALEGRSTPPETDPPATATASTAAAAVVQPEPKKEDLLPQKVWSPHPDAPAQAPIPMVWDLPAPEKAAAAVVSAEPVKPAPTAVPPVQPIVAPAPASKREDELAASTTAAPVTPSTTAAASKPASASASKTTANGEDSKKGTPSLAQTASVIAKSAAALDAFTASTKPASSTSSAPTNGATASSAGAKAVGAQPAKPAAPIFGASSWDSTKPQQQQHQQHQGGATASTATFTTPSKQPAAAGSSWNFAPSATASAAQGSTGVWDSPAPTLVPAKAAPGGAAVPLQGNGLPFGLSSTATPISGYSAAYQQPGFRGTPPPRSASMGIATASPSISAGATTGMGAGGTPGSASAVRANRKYLEMQDPFAGL